MVIAKRCSQRVHPQLQLCLAPLPYESLGATEVPVLLECGDCMLKTSSCAESAEEELLATFSRSKKATSNVVRVVVFIFMCCRPGTSLS
jgi:hypothetical protein